MVVSNVDYLTNAVALKLNAFDVSPQAPQVLLMMVRLAGPSLLPYLEDTVESIFAALEDYHGYTTLVELLFAVLKTMAEEGVRAPQLVIAAGKETEATSNEPAVTSTKDLVSLIRSEADRSRSRKREEDAHKSEVLSFPHRPWKDEHSKPMSSDMPPDPFSGIIPEEDEEATEPEAVQPPIPKTYALLLKITQLTQHYLSSSSASLRTSLLSLIRTTIPALAKHEDSYLPLVNTLWPEIISRLHDPESHVVAGSLDIIAIMCEYAGGFMRSRIETLWPDLISLHSRLKREMTGANSSSAPASLALTERGRSTSLAYVDPTVQAAWQHFIDSLTAIVAHVAVGAELFEDVLSMLHPVSRVAPDVRRVLARYNADAVWLCELREDSLESPLVRPTGSLGWAFAEVAG
ncbi:hypothetical protein M8818_005628 [Zalaria obscura]|uniref:Uncharacterized protein n=1 Tax=Zalaria obscura TaxID=2024903 RepID=A0ACC3S939_9PEZI